MARANTAKTSGKPAVKASKTKVTRSAQPAKAATSMKTKATPTKAATSAKATKAATPAASKKVAKPAKIADPTESIERSVREGATVTEHGPGLATRTLVESDHALLLLIARGEPTSFVVRDIETRSGAVLYRVVAQFMIYDTHEGERVVRDIKEQEVPLGPPELLTDNARLAAFWLGANRALARILATRPAAVDVAMPYDLIPTKLLARQSFRTAEQFEKAALGKSYLGRLQRELKTR